MNNVPRVLDMFPEDPAPVVVEKKINRRTPQNPVKTAPEGDFEALAQRLGQHPDYRIQRRLQPILQWPAVAGSESGTRRVVVLDTETTGLDCARESIIELAMLCVDVDIASGLPVGPVDVYDGFEDPGKPIPREVVALTGITDADVKGQSLNEARITSMLAGAHLVIAHNAGFDRPFVEHRMPQFAALDWACSFADIDWKAHGRTSAKLEGLAHAEGWFYDAHRAEMDCHALLQVLARALPGDNQTALSHLLRAASEPSYTLQATQAPFEEKDKLKARGYRWNAEQRVWQIRLRDRAALSDETQWLREHVFVGRRNAQVQVEMQDALVRYSPRPGKISLIAL